MNQQQEAEIATRIAEALELIGQKVSDMQDELVTIVGLIAKDSEDAED